MRSQLIEKSNHLIADDLIMNTVGGKGENLDIHTVLCLPNQCREDARTMNLEDCNPDIFLSISQFGKYCFRYILAQFKVPDTYSPTFRLAFNPLSLSSGNRVPISFDMKVAFATFILESVTEEGIIDVSFHPTLPVDHHQPELGHLLNRVPGTLASNP